jgi:hypothetical protein
MPIPTTNATKELPAVNQILASVGQAPVTTLDQTNPDVAIAYDTLLEVSKEVQGEGWTFNQEFEYEITTDNNKQYEIPNNMLQIDFSESYKGDIDVVRRRDPQDDKVKLYDRYNHKYELGTVANDTWEVDVTWFFDWVDLPQPIQNYITAKAATITAQRIVGDPALIQTLQQREALARANALEYECNQGDYTIFGHPHGKRSYTSYKPYTALQR